MALVLRSSPFSTTTLVVCQPIRLYVLDDVLTFATEDGEFIGETRIDPNRDYQPKGAGFR
jgi:hypothetical protein